MPPDCGRLRICTTLITFILLAAKSWMYAVWAGQGGHNLSGIYQACALQIETPATFLDLLVSKP